jgi:uncharacterized protein (TIGR03790 family)
LGRKLLFPAGAFVLALSWFIFPTPARGGGGPRNVLVVVNENAEESLEIGNYYLRQRRIPAANLCRVQTTAALTTDMPAYLSEIEDPIKACISASPYRDRIDYIVLTRGFPIRTYTPAQGADSGGYISITAQLQLMDTAFSGRTQDAALPSPTIYSNVYCRQFTGTMEYFSHSKTFTGMNLYIATMLSGYWTADGTALVDRSIASDGNPPTDNGGTFYLEDATGNANVRNSQIPTAVAVLMLMGVPAAHIIDPADVPLGSIVASHLNGGSYSGISQAEIESYNYPAGCIVDALESYGLVPQNFDPYGSPSQTPVTWWVSAGVTGGHGTVAEPYNIAFPRANLFEPYVMGYNLGETFYLGIPTMYWMNLVLGDPLAAPYAHPPAVTIQSPADGASVGGTVSLEASASTLPGHGIRELEFFVDDTLVSTFPSGSGQLLWDSAAVADGRHRFEVVAYEDTAVYAQATAGVDFQVDNHGLALTITDPPAGSQVAGSFSATVEAVGGITDVTLRAGGLDVGVDSGVSPFVVDIDTSLLGRGWNTLLAEGSDAGGRFCRSAGLDFYVVKPPRFSRLDPAEGPASGGTAVLLEGWNLEPDMKVYFGGAEAAGYNHEDCNHVEVVTPPNSAGPVDVILENPLGLTFTETGGFTYVNGIGPLVQTIAPDTGGASGGETVTLTGLNFTGATGVTIDGVPATGVSVESDTQITVLTGRYRGPTPKRGRVDVVSPGATGSLLQAYVYFGAPVVSGVHDDYDVVSGGKSIVISGKNFYAVSAVRLAGVPADTFRVDSPNQITAVVGPAPDPRLGAVEVDNPEGTGTRPDGFLYISPDPPSVLSVTPDHGGASGGTAVTLTGTNFLGATGVVIAGVPAPDYDVLSDTQMTAVAAPYGGSTPNLGDVVVTTPSGTGSLPQSFTYFGTPVVNSVADNFDTVSGGKSVVITGENFFEVVGVSLVGIPVQTFVVDSPTQITAVTAPAPLPAVGNVVVANTEGSGVLNNGFEYVPAPCPVTAPVAGLKVTRLTGGKLRLDWSPSVDPCLTIYRVFVAADTLAGRNFPFDYTDITDLDEDGNRGTDPSFLYAPPAGALFYYQAAGEGTDGTVGPK